MKPGPTPRKGSGTSTTKVAPTREAAADNPKSMPLNGNGSKK